MVQGGLGYLGQAVPGLGALHGINALVLFGVAVMAGKRVGSSATVPDRRADGRDLPLSRPTPEYPRRPAVNHLIES